jgi:hypothetical protein
MTRLFVVGGPYMFPLGLLAAVIAALSVKKAIDLFARTGLGQERLARGLSAILFWGCFSAVLGLLGQFSGIYRSLMVIRSAPAVNPGLVAEGLAVSLITTIFGLCILGVSGIVWFGLRCRLDTLTERGEGARRVEGHPG